MAAVAGGVQLQAFGQVVRRAVVLVGQGRVQGVGSEAVVGLFREVDGIGCLVVSLRVAPLLVDEVVGIVGLYAQGAFVVAAVHAVSVGRPSLVEQRAAGVQRSAEGRQVEQGGECGSFGYISGQEGLFVAQVTPRVVGLQGEDALPSASQLQGAQGTFPQGCGVSVGVFGQSAACFEVREPLVARLLVQPQVQGHLFGVNFPLQGADGLVVLHQLG